MKFRSHLGADIRPELKLHWRAPPVEWTADAGGSLELATGPIDIEFGRIPITLRIPFHRGRVVAASVGPFRARIRPVSATLRACDVRATFGSEACGGEVDVGGQCRAEAEMHGERHRDPPPEEGCLP